MPTPKLLKKSIFAPLLQPKNIIITLLVVITAAQATTLMTCIEDMQAALRVGYKLGRVCGRAPLLGLAKEASKICEKGEALMGLVPVTVQYKE